MESYNGFSTTLLALFAAAVAWFAKNFISSRGSTKSERPQHKRRVDEGWWNIVYVAFGMGWFTRVANRQDRRNQFELKSPLPQETLVVVSITNSGATAAPREGGALGLLSRSLMDAQKFRELEMLYAEPEF